MPILILSPLQKIMRNPLSIVLFFLILTTAYERGLICYGIIKLLLFKFLLYLHMLIMQTVSIVRSVVQTDFSLNHTFINMIVNRIAGFFLHATSCTLVHACIVLVVFKKRGEAYY